MKRLGFVLLAMLCFPVACWAHVGSKDVFEQVNAGPYKLFVTIRMPNVIPGVATVEAHTEGAAVSAVEIAPLPLTGEASKHAPAPDAMARSKEDPAFFTGGVWMMASGAWQVRFNVSGARGAGTASVPVPAVAVQTLAMPRSLGWTLALMGLFLVVKLAATIAAATREARLPAGAEVTPSLRRRGVVAMGGSLAVMALALWGGAAWWRVDAASFANGVYRPLIARAEVQGDTLHLQVSAKVSSLPAWAGNPLQRRANNDFLADHGKLIHLYAIREPGMDAVFHLHPEFDREGGFRMRLPTLPPGEYRLYGDVVHANGFPETLVTTVAIPAGFTGVTLAPDDAEAFPAPLGSGREATTYALPDRYTMAWDRPATLEADTAQVFRFRLLGPDGLAANDMQPYLGMAGHAAFVKADGTVFAHTHPEGSAPMASLMLANENIAAMESTPASITNTVGFPYGFPSAGVYRILVQMKHGGVVETGVFDATVLAAPAR